MSFVEHVRARLTCLGVPSGGAVVAVSGGADSVALLHALIQLRSDDTPLVVGHLNHGLRGVESDGDEAFVRELVARLSADGVAGLELRCKRVAMAELAATEGANLEAVARRERYAWLARVAAELGLAYIATGHTADDQAETILHRLLRGTGLQGLRGIAPMRELRPGVTLIRPMLAVTRVQILIYLKEIGQSFRTDQSNADLRFTRNRIRHELLPLLAEQYNPGISQILARLAEQAAEIFRDVEERAQALLTASELPRAGEMIIVDREKLRGLPRHLIRDMLRLLWQREGWSRDRLRFQEWDRAAAVVLGELPALDLPGRVTMKCRKRVVQIGAGSG